MILLLLIAPFFLFIGFIGALIYLNKLSKEEYSLEELYEGDELKERLKSQRQSEEARAMTEKLRKSIARAKKAQETAKEPVIN